MTKFYRALCFSSALLFAVLPIAAQNASPQKVGFVNFAEALQGTAEVKAKIVAIQQFVDSKNAESDERIDAINKLRDQLNLGTAPDADAASRELERLEVDFRRFQEDTQVQINDRRTSLFQEYTPKLQAVIEELGRNGNWDMILTIDPETIYVAPQLNLTQQAIALYDEKNPVP